MRKENAEWLLQVVTQAQGREGDWLAGLDDANQYLTAIVEAHEELSQLQRPKKHAHVEVMI